MHRWKLPYTCIKIFKILCEKSESSKICRKELTLELTPNNNSKKIFFLVYAATNAFVVIILK